MNRKRLQAVLRVRTLQERGARGELARRTQAHQRAQAAEERTWELLQGVQAAGGDPLSLQTAVAVRDAGTRAVERQHDTTEAAREGVVGAREEWTIAARRVEALDRLGERLREADEAEQERLQILEIDDLVLARRGRGPIAEEHAG
ncbi:MAG: flagellar FliJ family protein [Acidimicrobiales bacterium]